MANLMFDAYAGVRIEQGLRRLTLSHSIAFTTVNRMRSQNNTIFILYPAQMITIDSSNTMISSSQDPVLPPRWSPLRGQRSSGSMDPFRDRAHSSIELHLTQVDLALDLVVGRLASGSSQEKE
jgi:hypothetical protein